MRNNQGLIQFTLLLMSLVLFLTFATQGKEERRILELEQEKAQIAEEKKENRLEKEDDLLFVVSLLYDEYQHANRYYIVLEATAKVHQEPGEESPVVATVRRFDFLTHTDDVLPWTVKGTEEIWYPVTVSQEKTIGKGFIKSTEVEEREFRFDRMEALIRRIDAASKEGALTRIESHRHPRKESAKGFISLEKQEHPVLLEDGTLVRYLFTKDRYSRVEIVSTGQRYYVESGFVADRSLIENPHRIIAIDRKNQNEAAYQKEGERWVRVSQTMATTGTLGPYAMPTPLGFYSAMEQKEQMVYYADNRTQLQGYAPYAIRFTGGAYIHGVPVDFQIQNSGERRTPPMQEYSGSIGTIPLSHKCVRNYTSHAKFLYEWYVKNEMVVIIFE